MSSTTVRLVCPNLKCRCLLSVPASTRGKTVRCRQCGMRIQVPAKALEKKPAAPAEAAESGETDG